MGYFVFIYESFSGEYPQLSFKVVEGETAAVATMVTTDYIRQIGPFYTYEEAQAAAELETQMAF